MKKIIRNNYFTGFLLFGLSILVFALGIWSIGLDINSSAISLWEICLPANFSVQPFTIVTLVFVIVLFVSLVPIVLTLISIFRKNNLFFFISIFYQLAIQITFFIIQGTTLELSMGAITLAIINTLILLGCFGLTMLRRYFSLHEKEEVAGKAKPNEQAAYKKTWKMLVIDAVQLFAAALVLFVPLYAVTSSGSTVYHVLVSSGSGSSINIADTVLFVVFFLLVLADTFFFLFLITLFLSDKKAFLHKSQQFANYNLIISVLFFLCGFIAAFVYSLNGVPSFTLGYVILIAMSATFFVFSIIKGKLDGIVGATQKDKKLKFFKVETLIYLLVITAITASALFLKVVVLKITYSPSNVIERSFNGFVLIRDYASMGPGYQFVAFYLVAMLLISFLLLLWAVCCYFTKYRNFNRVAKVVAYVNVAMVLAIGVMGYYFEIVKALNTETLIYILDYYHIPYSDTTTYNLSSQMVFALGADVLVLVTMLIRKAFDKEPYSLTGFENALSGMSSGASSNEPASATAESSSSEPASTNDGTEPLSIEEVFDPCPAFSDLDSKLDFFKNELEIREKEKATAVTLNKLVSFVVNYAKNSRLHLSYSQEDIAAFVSGLGACRLSILQGMSGTGKTSLPKIFMEAVYGNCSLVEVESSWKDKNELLGYYNEFSNLYTPKKFTIALYRAAMNPTIPTFIVLDEMNLSRIEYYFSDFLSLMENEEDKREIKLLNIKLEKGENGAKTPYSLLKDGYSLHIPANVWFIGTANRDESTFVISDKVYDRAYTMNFNKRAPKVSDNTTPIKKQFYSYDMLQKLFQDAISKGTFDAEKSGLIQKVEKLLRPFNISFGNRILNQMEDFVDIYQACFPDKDVLNEAIETILLSKVVGKLEVKTIDNREELIKDFENLKLYRCAEFISTLNED
ncbi:MAG TPA: hypothetical protein PKO28_03840 [Bacilli bacterium]|nr:hypothetical protein [Bacilli bacterium]HPS18953.1 hypothetical protein [Bacilli bacterium]